MAWVQQYFPDREQHGGRQEEDKTQERKTCLSFIFFYLVLFYLFKIKFLRPKICSDVRQYVIL